MFNIFQKSNNAFSQRLNKFHHLLSTSFENVKRDTKHIREWLDYLNNKSQRQDHIIAHLTHKITTLSDPETVVEKALSGYHKTQEQNLHYQIHQILQSYYHLNSLSDQISKLNSRVTDLSLRVGSMPSEFDHLKSRLAALESKKIDIKANLKEKLLKKITKSSKEYIKNLVISLIRKYGKISGFQLKEMVVDEQGLCSKSSFYRVLTEIENSPDIDMVKEGKEKVYLSHISAHNQ